MQQRCQYKSQPLTGIVFVETVAGRMELALEQFQADDRVDGDQKDDEQENVEKGNHSCEY